MYGYRIDAVRTVLDYLLSDPLPGGGGSDGSLTYPAVGDCYDVRAVADEVLALFVTGGGLRPPLCCLRPDICPPCSGPSPSSTPGRLTTDPRATGRRLADMAGVTSARRLPACTPHV